MFRTDQLFDPSQMLRGQRFVAAVARSLLTHAAEMYFADSYPSDVRLQPRRLVIPPAAVGCKPLVRRQLMSPAVHSSKRPNVVLNCLEAIAACTSGNEHDSRSDHYTAAHSTRRPPRTRRWRWGREPF